MILTLARLKTWKKYIINVETAFLYGDLAESIYMMKPIGYDENRIYDTIFSYNKVKHYVCSDDKNTEMKFKKLNNVVIYPKSSYVEKFKDGGWNDVITDNEGRRFNFNVNRPKQSVIEAFVDLLILSRTKISVNSVSSFLNFAKLYSNIEL